MVNLIVSIILGLTIIALAITCIKEKKIFLKSYSMFYAPLLLIMIALFLYGLAEESEIKLVFDAIANSVSAIAFKDNFKAFKPEIQADFWFVINYYLGLIVIGFITFSCAIDLVFKTFLNEVKRVFIRNNAVVVLMDDDEEAKLFLDSCDKKYVILDKKNKELEKELLDKNICYFVGLNDKNINKFKNKNAKIVSFIKDPQVQIIVINLLKNTELLSYLEVNDDMRFGVVEMVKNNSNINLFNKYDIIADEFILNHSISKYLSSSMIDRNTASLKSDVDVSMFMIGFGKVNANLYLELIKNNQYTKIIDQKITTYPVRYNIFSRMDIDTSNLNHNLRRIRYITPSDEYLPWPEDSFIPNKYIGDINSFEFYNNIKNNIVNKGLNVFIVSLGNDLTNIDMALKINDRLKSWKFNSEAIIFVRVRDSKNLNLKIADNIIAFGSDDDVITKDAIVNQSILEISKKRAAYYANSDDVEGVWRLLPLAKRLSNKNSIFSIIHKLGLLGITVDRIKENSISVDEYLKIYDVNNEIIKMDNKIEYPLKFSKLINPRNVLAFIEHNRWNVEMITKGYVPMKKSLFKVEGKKFIKDDLDEKLHGCITTSEGLDEYFDIFASMLQKENNISYEDAYKMVENKKYDYEIMDQAYDLLSNIGYYLKIKE